MRFIYKNTHLAHLVRYATHVAKCYFGSESCAARIGSGTAEMDRQLTA